VRILLVSLATITVLALVLAVAYSSIVPLTIACLTMAVALGLGQGATFKLVPEWFPDRVGAVTGVVGAAGGLGGFFPPLVLGAVGYTLGFVLMALVAVACLAVLAAIRPRAAAAAAG
jgi:NNP family nitrate/nitrite transporter-like MFS transporter